jgi:hypothetical protein
MARGVSQPRPVCLARWLALPAALLTLVACDEPGQYPPGGGGGGGGTTSDADAAPADAAPGSGVRGRVCAAPDLLAPDGCGAGTAVAGVSVELIATGDTTTTANDGSFALPVSTAPVAILRAVDGEGFYRSSLVPFATPGGSGSELRLPMLREADYRALQVANGFTESAGVDATLAVYVVDGASAPVSGAIVVPEVDGVPYYDDGNPVFWRQDQSGTGDAGVALVVGVTASAVGFTGIEVLGASRSVQVAAIPIAPDAITFLTVTL